MSALAVLWNGRFHTDAEVPSSLSKEALGIAVHIAPGTLPPAQLGKDRMGKDMVGGHANCVSLFLGP